ncbi:hypothetical protein ADL21_37465 [Streptomyces albus subsp. albus]|nr:hypothetical protein ADL21_37465 [Streptomyces albus subsp. albus]
MGSRVLLYQAADAHTFGSGAAGAVLLTAHEQVEVFFWHTFAAWSTARFRTSAAVVQRWFAPPWHLDCPVHASSYCAPASRSRHELSLSLRIMNALAAPATGCAYHFWLCCPRQVCWRRAGQARFGIRVLLRGAGDARAVFAIGRFGGTRCAPGGLSATLPTGAG